MLGHPAFVARDVGGDAQREAFLAQQRIAAVAGTVGPDLARLREVDDVLLLVARPGNILLAGRERRADGVHAGHDALLVLVDLLEHRQADARHDAHVHHDVGRIGELHADLRHGRADRAHAEGQHVHGAAAHAAGEELLELPAHLERIFPVVGRPRVVLRQRADEGAIFDAGHVAGIRARVIAARPQLLVQLDERAAGDHLLRRAGRILPASHPPSEWRPAWSTRPFSRPTSAGARSRRAVQSRFCPVFLSPWRARPVSYPLSNRRTRKWAAGWFPTSLQGLAVALLREFP